MTTDELLEKYLLSFGMRYKDIKLYNYTINGSILRLQYSYDYDFSDGRSYDSDNYVERELLDYITWVYNQSIS